MVHWTSARRARGTGTAAIAAAAMAKETREIETCMVIVMIVPQVDCFICILIDCLESYAGATKI